ncbi:CD166 antigen [Ambystoma mexicanum]|uniref:CD166 antigen n=1 Tax=Ambystoma mexicanum TaxID=8296 RepID=UPI0037E9C6EB
MSSLVAAVLCGLCALLAAGPGLASRTVRGWYNETIAVPCGRDTPPPGLLFVKWKYEKPDGSPVFLAYRKNATVKFESVAEFAGRLRLREDYTLDVDAARVTDARRLVCVMVTDENVFEEATSLVVFKAPTRPEIESRAAFLPAGEQALLGECLARDSYPVGNLTWYKNGQPLEPAEGAVLVESSSEQDPASRLYTLRSLLSYQASRETVGDQFTCSVTYQALDKVETISSEPASFDVHFPTEQLTIDILSPTHSFREGDNITLRCTADGNPPPEKFLFYHPGQDEGTLSSNVFTMADVKRNASGDYKCGLSDGTATSPTTAIVVHYLDLLMVPIGDVTKLVGEALQVTCTPTASENVPVVWMKDGVKLPSAPPFTSIQYQDAGKYTCESNLAAKGVMKRQTLTLNVEGKPRLKLTKLATKDGKAKTVTCQVEGFPKPIVHWVSSDDSILVNQTQETDYANWKFSSKLTITPLENSTLTCIAENKVERTSLSLNVSAINIPEPEDPEDENEERDERVNDHAKLIVGIVVGLLLAALVAGVAYWFYSKKAKTGAKRNDKELGTVEETKTLEENNHKSEA